MKKLLSLMLIVAMICALCACSNTNSESEELEDSIESRAQRHVESYVRTYMSLGFENASPHQVEIARFTPDGENEWEISGSASFKNEYGDVYGGTFEGTVEYNTESDEFGCDIELEDSFKKIKGALDD